jgi:hypothetical protein
VNQLKRTVVLALALGTVLTACSGGGGGSTGASGPGAQPGARQAATACDVPSGSSRHRAATPVSSGRRGRGAGGRSAQLSLAECEPAR